MRGRNGFTLIEMLIVVVVMGMVAVMGFPRVRDAIRKQNVRSARLAVGTLAAKARALAVHRGCRAVLHFTAGSSGRIWVTVCQVNGTGVDTLGGVEYLAERFRVTLTPTRDSVQYDMRGLSLDNQATTIRLAGSGIQDSVVINSVGKVMRS